MKNFVELKNGSRLIDMNKIVAVAFDDSVGQISFQLENGDYTHISFRNQQEYEQDSAKIKSILLGTNNS